MSQVKVAVHVEDASQRITVGDASGRLTPQRPRGIGQRVSASSGHCLFRPAATCSKLCPNLTRELCTSTQLIRPSISGAYSMSRDDQVLTFTYKTLGEVAIQLHLYPPSILDAESGDAFRLSPAVVYFHGGGLTVGTAKSWFPKWLKGALAIYLTVLPVSLSNSPFYQREFWPQDSPSSLQNTDSFLLQLVMMLLRTCRICSNSCPWSSTISFDRRTPGFESMPTKSLLLAAVQGGCARISLLCMCIQSQRLLLGCMQWVAISL